MVAAAQNLNKRSEPRHFMNCMRFLNLGLELSSDTAYPKAAVSLAILFTTKRAAGTET